MSCIPTGHTPRASRPRIDRQKHTSPKQLCDRNTRRVDGPLHSPTATRFPEDLQAFINKPPMPPPTSTPTKSQPQKQSHKTHPQNTAAKHSDKNTASNTATKTQPQKHTHAHPKHTCVLSSTRRSMRSQNSGLSQSGQAGKTLMVVLLVSTITCWLNCVVFRPRA